MNSPQKSRRERASKEMKPGYNGSNQFALIFMFLRVVRVCRVRFSEAGGVEKIEKLNLNQDCFHSLDKFIHDRFQFTLRKHSLTIPQDQAPNSNCI